MLKNADSGNKESCSRNTRVFILSDWHSITGYVRRENKYYRSLDDVCAAGGEV
jgi:hypothetical protein